MTSLENNSSLLIVLMKEIQHGLMRAKLLEGDSTNKLNSKHLLKGYFIMIVQSNMFLEGNR